MQDQPAPLPYTSVEHHWLTGAKRVPSPNTDARPEDVQISLIVLHCISLPPGQFEPATICDFFCNRLDISKDPYFEGIRSLKVSSHLLVDRQGGVIQFVPFDQRAWHAGQSEFAGRSACNDFSIGIELSGSDDTPYTQQQYAALIQTIRCLHRAYPATAEHPVVGHCHIAPERKTDPGPAFEWHKLSEQGIAVYELDITD